MSAQQASRKQAKHNGTATSKQKTANISPDNRQGIPQEEIRQNSGISASMALQAAQKAWDLRQAANAAGDPNAREEILAKAINKEIEAESFGKAAKYTRSGAFQGLAAGAGLGVQPGVTLGKLTGALVGGVVSTVTGLLGGGVGSVYGAMNGPFWDLGEMASQGVRSIVGDFPNWKSTPSQKKALEKMVMQTRETQAPTKEELEEMKADAPDEMSPSWSQAAKDMSSWRPSMPSMPSVPKGAALGLGGLGASMPSWGGCAKSQDQQQVLEQPKRRIQAQNQPASQPRVQQLQSSSGLPPKQAGQKPRESPKPMEASTPKEAPKVEQIRSQKAPTSSKSPKPQVTPKPRTSTPKSQASPPKNASKPQAASKPPISSQSRQTSSGDNKENKSPATAEKERKKPRKLASKSGNEKSSEATTIPRKAPRKLESRRTAA